MASTRRDEKGHLLCWGHGWQWQDCVGVGNPNADWGNVTLQHLTKKRILLTWHANQHRQKPSGHRLVDLTKPSVGRPAIDIITDFKPEVSAQIPFKVQDENVQYGSGERDTRFRRLMNMTSSGPAMQPKYVAARVPSGTSLIIEDVAPDQVYQIQMLPHPGTSNMTSIYFQLQGNTTWTHWPELMAGPDVPRYSGLNPGSLRPVTGPPGPRVVRVEEVSLIVLVLALWMVAILLFVHRWGKIRMLEPYQPEYKPITEPGTPPGSTLTGPIIGPCGHYSVATSTYRGPPRKSSSLCFTPSMFQTLPSYRGRLTHQQSTTSRHSLPASARHAARRRAFKMRSDSLSHQVMRPHHHHHHHLHHYHPFCRKARSAENLRNCRMSFNQSFEEPFEIRTAGSSCSPYAYTAGIKPPYRRSASVADSDNLAASSGAPLHKPAGGAKTKWSRCVNSSLENCRGASLPITSHEQKNTHVLETGVRGKSLDSASTTSARRLADGRVTPELRVSPPPPSPNEPTSPRPRSANVYFNYMSKYKNQSLDYPSSYSSVYNSPSSSSGSMPYLNKFSSSPQTSVPLSYPNKFTSSSSPSNSPKEAKIGRSSGIAPGRQFGLQRQEPIEETFFPPHYPTLVEEQEEDSMLGSSDKEALQCTASQPVGNTVDENSSAQAEADVTKYKNIKTDIKMCRYPGQLPSLEETSSTEIKPPSNPTESVDVTASDALFSVASSESFQSDSGPSESPQSPSTKAYDAAKAANSDVSSQSYVITSQLIEGSTRDTQV
ncbi:serine/arginine repetitive matrix protein 2-like [Hyalella azteca]|uniref:Serine/arginine repetitive matrix protein 2-like n=1 Tax=Hyalella azteca TaxID=294128 RepID=A0A979FGQ5_HYAAZ|nr:serine/arginine repetitive matrix protein 2-like [Hyalella azteca]